MPNVSGLVKAIQDIMRNASDVWLCFKNKNW